MDTEYENIYYLNDYNKILSEEGENDVSSDASQSSSIAISFLLSELTHSMIIMIQLEIL